MRRGPARSVVKGGGLCTTKILNPEIMATMLPEDFPAEKLSQPQYKTRMEKDVFVTMRDGVRVAVDIFRPDAPGKFPALLCAHPYQKDLLYLPQWPVFHFRETNDIDWFVSRGYAYVNMDIRGCGKSMEGQFQFRSQEEQNDFYDLIEWTADQTWCTGRVGMIGESYPAQVQWFAAALQPPHLACIVPFDAGADMYRDMSYHGGLMALGFTTAWWSAEIRANYRLGKYGPDPNVGSWDMPWHVLKPSYFRRVLEEYENLTSRRSECPLYSIGILHKTGLHLRGNVCGYEDDTRRLGSFFSVTAISRVTKWPYLIHPRLRLLHLRWYDHWLKDNDTGFMDEPPVTFFLRNKEAYQTENEWPSCSN